MEGKVSTARREACIKQCVKNTSRPKQPGKCPDYVNTFYFTGPAWIPVGQKRNISKSTYVLEAKVKALKEKRNIINQQAEVTPQEPGSPKKAKGWKMKPPTQPALQNEILEPQAQIHTYLTDMLLDSADYPLQMQEESQGAVLANLYVKDFETLSKAAEEPTEDLKKVPGRNITEKKSFLGSTAGKASLNGVYASSSLNDLSFMQKSFEETNGKDSHLVQAKEFESNSFMRKNDSLGKLWRTESWDSLGSGSSNTLAERVERNRSMLQEMLSTSQLNNHYLWEPHTLHHCKKEIPVPGREEPSNEILPNEVAWNSSVSLQYSEGCSKELELSHRHEQAKQPLQRARMKARTNPLRASHSILPTTPLERRSACRLTDANAKNIALKNGDIHARENLSESCSGESSCGQQRKQGLSPSRVHFEDESAKDAEVRYLERLPQRQKRVLDSVFLSLGKEPLISKPDLSGYINSDLQRKENNISKCDLDHQSMGQAARTLIHQSNRECYEKGKSLQVNKERKSNACGSYINNSADSGVKQTGNGKHEISSVSHEGSDLEHTKGSKELVVSQENSQTKTLGPKGTPLWILPSRQHVYTGCIRELYIGEVTCTDGVDSAIGSTTVTSDSCRAGKEEAGTNIKQLGIKTHWHGMPSPNPRPLCSSEKETVQREVSWANCSCETNGKAIQDNKPNISQVEIGSRTNEANNCNEQRAFEVRNQVIQMSLPRSNQVIDLCQMAKDVKAKGHTRVPGTQLREPMPTTNSQQLLSHDDAEDSVNSPANNLGQIKQVKSPQQQTKHMANYHLMKLIPAPPTTGKAHSSPVPYRRAVLTGKYKLSNQDLGHMDKANELSISSSFVDFQDMGIPGPKEQNGMQNPKMLFKHQFLDLFSNDCNNIYTNPKPKTLVTVREKIREEHLQESDKMRKNQVSSSSSTCSVPPVAPSAINLSLSEDTNFMNSTQSINKETPLAEAQKLKAGQTGIIHCKTFEVFPEPKKQQSFKKGEISSMSVSGLKKFFTTLSQSTKQRLGRFRCYSMEQICTPESGASIPNMDPGPDTTCFSKIKKAPSLQSLQMMSPFCQPRKSSSVQNLHSFWDKHNRSNLYLLRESKDDEAVSNRKAKTQHRRSLSIEDIGSPNTVRTVGRVVAVFPDGTSQLELQRPQQGNFGFRVSSGNGRPDTGIYVQEMTDTSTAKLYAGILGVGDEILEVNGAKVAGLGLAQINELLLWAETVSIRVLRQRPIQQ